MRIVSRLVQLAANYTPRLIGFNGSLMCSLANLTGHRIGIVPALFFRLTRSTRGQTQQSCDRGYQAGLPDSCRHIG